MWFAANTPRGSGAGDTSGDAAAVAEQRRALRRRGVSPAPRRRQTPQARRRSGGKDHDLHAHIRALERTVEHSARQMEEMERRFAALSPGPQLSPQQPPPPPATAAWRLRRRGRRSRRSAPAARAWSAPAPAPSRAAAQVLEHRREEERHRRRGPLEGRQAHRQFLVHRRRPCLACHR